MRRAADLGFEVRAATRTETSSGGAAMYILDSVGPVLAATGAAAAAGADVILGGAGADWVFAGAGDDYAEGDAGMDLYQYGAGTRFFIALDADAEQRCGVAA